MDIKTLFFYEFLYELIAEQTNPYSVQAAGSSIKTNLK